MFGLVSVLWKNGLDGSPGWRVTLALTYGRTSRRPGVARLSSPTRSPNRETKPEPSGVHGLNETRSERRAMSRMTWKPQTRGVPGDTDPYLSCDNGIRNSAVQPSGSRCVATSHTASQLV